MTDNAELQAKIAAISGRILEHKQQQPPYAPPPHYAGQQYSPQQYRGHARWTPYGHGGRGGFAPSHKNRSLVLNSNSTPPSATAGSDPSDSPAYITTRSTNKQLMTKDTFEREQQQKLDLVEQQQTAKRQKRNTQERSRILRHVDSSIDHGSREMVIEGIRFQLTSDGSKLIRVPDAATAGKETPKKYRVVGVEFFRTKSGNLLRASALTTTARYHWTTLTSVYGSDSLLTYCRPHSSKPQCEHFTKHGTTSSNPHQAGHSCASATRIRHRTRRAGEYPRTSLTCAVGTCPYGPRCHFAHDPHKVAICKDFFKTGTCFRGNNCDLSHEMTYHRVPACQYFLRGNCTNGACRYPHVSVSPAANVCRAFALLGFCAKGADCDKRHVHECPDYANSGSCANRENGKCTLPHPDRASTLRKAAERQAKMDSEANSDVSSEASQGDADMEDIDSDNDDILMTGTGDDSHELSQQQDFVGFT